MGNEAPNIYLLIALVGMIGPLVAALIFYIIGAYRDRALQLVAEREARKIATTLVETSAHQGFLLTSIHGALNQLSRDLAVQRGETAPPQPDQQLKAIADEHNK